MRQKRGPETSPLAGARVHRAPVIQALVVKVSRSRRHMPIEIAVMRYSHKFCTIRGPIIYFEKISQLQRGTARMSSLGYATAPLT